MSKPLTFPFDLPARYEPPSKVMQGGQGQVFICNDRYLERKVAIKVLDLYEDSADLKKEIRALSEVHSRHVVEVYDVLEDPDEERLGLVQEFVSGPNLEDYLSNSSDSFARVLWQITSGVCDIHAKRKIHRDLKPENIRVDSENVLKILDFGISMELPDTITTRARGTLFYAAPELFGNPPIRLSPAVDVYAVGVLAWFIGSGGALPTFLKAVPRSKTSLVQSIAALKLNVSATLEDIIDRALEVDPGRRPGASEICNLLERQILYGRHRAQISTGGRTQILDTPGATADLTAGSDKLRLQYDGFRFFIFHLKGDVYINNEIAHDGQELPRSCVITLGGPGLGWARTFVPVDMSHPGVVI